MPYRSERKRRAYFKNRDNAVKADCNRRYYVQNSEYLKDKGRLVYHSDPDRKKALSRASYYVHCNKKKAAVSALPS